MSDSFGRKKIEITDLTGRTYSEKTYRFSLVSMIITFVFMVYNGSIGYRYRAPWNVSICIYYAVLLIIKTYILYSAKRCEEQPPLDFIVYQKKVLNVTHCILLLLDFSLIAPIAYMTLGRRDYRFGLIPAIAMAAYTTYRVWLGIHNYRKSKRAHNLFVGELRTINLIDTFLAVLSLQNTLILANGGYDDGRRRLAMYTSSAALVFIVIITVVSYVNGRHNIYDIEQDV